MILVYSTLFLLASAGTYTSFEQTVYEELNRARTEPDKYYQEMKTLRDEKLVWENEILYICDHSATFNSSAGMVAADCEKQGGTLYATDE